MSLKESIADMLDAIATGDEAGATDIAHAILADKAEAALENMRVDIANQMFGAVHSEE